MEPLLKSLYEYLITSWVCSSGPLRSILAHLKATMEGFSLRTAKFVHNTELGGDFEGGRGCSDWGGAVAGVEST